MKISRFCLRVVLACAIPCLPLPLSAQSNSATGDSNLLSWGCGRTRRAGAAVLLRQRPVGAGIFAGRNTQHWMGHQRRRPLTQGLHFRASRKEHYYQPRLRHRTGRKSSARSQRTSRSKSPTARMAPSRSSLLPRSRRHATISDSHLKRRPPDATSGSRHFRTGAIPSTWKS